MTQRQYNLEPSASTPSTVVFAWIAAVVGWVLVIILSILLSLPIGRGSQAASPREAELRKELDARKDWLSPSALNERLQDAFAQGRQAAAKDIDLSNFVSRDEYARALAEIDRLKAPPPRALRYQREWQSLDLASVLPSPAPATVILSVTSLSPDWVLATDTRQPTLVHRRCPDARIGIRYEGGTLKNDRLAGYSSAIANLKVASDTLKKSVDAGQVPREQPDPAVQRDLTDATAREAAARAAAECFKNLPSMEVDIALPSGVPVAKIRFE